MKKTCISAIILALFLFTGAPSATSLGIHKNHPAKAARRINMTGPSTISLSGGPYTYTVNLAPFGGHVALGSRWVIMAPGTQHIIWQAAADITSGGTISLEAYGFFFGSTGTGFILQYDDGVATIYGNKSITVQ